MYILLVLQNVITLSVNLADNMMLGAYSEVSLSGVAAVNQIQFILQCLVGGVGGGLLLAVIDTRLLRLIFSALVVWSGFTMIF